MILKICWVTLAVLGVVAVVVVGIGWGASEKIIHPPAGSPIDPKAFVLPLKDVYFESRDGLRLAGWFVGGTNGATIILAHGRGSDHSHMLADANYLHENGFSVFLFDFRYRGKSEGDAQTIGAKEAWDIESAVNFLKTRIDVDAARIGVQGHSMGAVAAILATAEMSEIQGVIAEIPFPSISSILCHTFEKELGLPCFPFALVTKWICELRLGIDLDRVAPVEVINKISPRPVFLIDDLEDDLFPPNSVEILFEAAREPKVLWQIPGCPHSQGLKCAPEEYERRVVAFWNETFGAVQP